MKKLCCLICMCLIIFYTAAPAQASWKQSQRKKDRLIHEADAAMLSFKKADPELRKFFDRAYGWAIFPTVGKGAFGIGGAYGEGIVYERNRIIGHTSLTQVSFGFQWGGQGYSQIIFFKDKAALDHFRSENFRLGAAASAVIATLGASADADFDQGLAIFTLVKGGLMYEISISGQKFKYWDY